MKPDFEIESHAKWILTGEHAVLRGHPALVFPIPTKFIKLFYWQTEEALQIEFNVPYEETFLVLFWGIFEEGLKLANKKQHDVTGRFFFSNNIPMGAGMGFSAAFCVSMARWFQWKKWITETECFEFARRLENYFHGKSSGVDIAGALYHKGIRFKIGGDFQPINVAWRPQLYLSSSHHVSVTSKCVHLVNELWEKDKNFAQKIDEDMEKSVLLAESALADEPKQGFEKLKDAINLANNCFARWELLGNEIKQHMDLLTEAGAVAVKPTGAGDGGYVLSLWDKTPQLPFEMIAVF